MYNDERATLEPLILRAAEDQVKNPKNAQSISKHVTHPIQHSQSLQL